MAFLVSTRQGDTDEIIFNIDIEVKPNPDDSNKTDFTFSGQLIFKFPGAGTEGADLDLEFDLVFDQQGDGKTLIAAYKNLGGADINVGLLLQLLNDTVPDLSINLKQAYFIYSKEDGASKYLLGAEVDAGLSLSNLPLIGRLYDNPDDLRLSITPLYTSDAYTGDQLAVYQSLLPGDGLALPDKDISAGVLVDIALFLGDQPIHLALPIGTPELGAARGFTPAASDQNGAGTVTTGTDSNDTTTWFDIDKSVVGDMVHLARVGVQYVVEDKRFWLKLDGSLTAGPFTLSIMGLGIGATLPDLIPAFQIKGLGLDFKRGGLELAGAFLHEQITDDEGNTYDEYAGLARLRYKLLSISVIGAYAYYKQHPSLFLYATLNYPLGGPSFFFVTGLALGFGINRKLNVPDAGPAVKNFPLVQQAINATADPPDLTEVMGALHDAIPPWIGQHFIAVGIRFTSFKLVDSFVLLTVSFGQHFEIKVLGISTLVIPPQLPGATLPADGSPLPGTLAKIVMTVSASFLPEEGILDVRADIDKESFVLSQDCHLHGGFAFRTWFTGTHKGDFVTTLGGYHPNFVVPSHYPTVPRLGLDWQVTEQLMIKGGMYFALTASAAMAGGYLKATYESHVFSAHFSLGANFLIAWKPFHYEANFFVEIGVETSIGSFDISADVEIWGPDFSGTADIDLTLASYHLDFGNDKGNLQPISWADFKGAFLPDQTETPISNFIANHGLIKELGANSFLVNPKSFELEFNTFIPITSVRGITISDLATPPSIGIGSMGLASVTSTLTVTLSGTLDPDKIDVKQLVKKAPAALWGDTLKPSLNGDRFIEDALMGFTLQVKEPEEPDSLSVPRDNLKYDTSEVEDGFAFADSLATFTASGGSFSPTDSGVAVTRAKVLSVLGFNMQTFELDIHPELPTALIDQPVSGTL